MQGRKRSRAGFSMIELAIVVAIIGALTAMGVGVFTELLPRYRTRQAAWKFAAAIAQARTMAVRDNVEYRIYLSQYDSSMDKGPNVGEYLMQVGDKSQNSNYWDTLPKEEARYDGCPPAGAWSDGFYGEGTINFSKGSNGAIPDVSLAPWSTIVGPSSTCQDNGDSIVLSPRGWITNPNVDFGTTGYISVDFVNKQAYLRGMSEVYRVSVARTGFARVDYVQASRFSDTSGNAMGVDGSSKQGNTSVAGE